MADSAIQYIHKEDIPVVDVASLFGDTPAYCRVGNALRIAAEETGFFYIKNHCIDKALIESVFEVSRVFFGCPEAQKSTVLVKDTHRGLLTFGASKMEHQKQPDLKESFIWGADLPPDNPEFVAGNKFFAPNQWPDFVPEMPERLNRYMRLANHCGKQLLKAFAAGLGVDHHYFVRQFNQPISRGTLIHYPTQQSAFCEDQFGVSPHTDFGTLTLLVQDQTGGLRIQGRRGEWLTAHPIEDTIVVNVGDLLACWTNDRFRSTVHAVVNQSGKERYSIVVAVDPDWDAQIRPVVSEGDRAHYGPAVCGEYIQGRFDRSFQYRSGRC